ncbi:MAG: hypothetical protein HY922_05660 [Elusimicrobia bacterium]|nr:hypothetical protein [Elusimicrobiota bacterium]
MSLIDKFLKDSVASHPALAVADSRRPVLRAEGNELVVSNILLPRPTLPSGSVELGRPTLHVRPYSAGLNRIAFHIRRIEFDDRSLLGAAQTAGWVSEERIFAQLVEGLKAGLRQGESIRLSHDLRKRLVYASFSPEFILPAGPSVRFDKVELEGENLVFSLGFSRAQAGASKDLEYMLGEGVINDVLKVLSDDKLSFRHYYSRASGVFLGVPRPGCMEISAFVNTGVRLPFPYAGRDLHAIFASVIRPSVSRENTLRLELERIDILWLGAGPENSIPNVPAFIQRHPGIQRLITDKTAEALAKNAELARYADVRKAGPSAIELRLKEGAILPALFRYFSIRGLRVEEGRLFLRCGLNL